LNASETPRIGSGGPISTWDQVEDRRTTAGRSRVLLLRRRETLFKRLLILVFSSGEKTNKQRKELKKK